MNEVSGGRGMNWNEFEKVFKEASEKNDFKKMRHCVSYVIQTEPEISLFWDCFIDLCKKDKAWALVATELRKPGASDLKDLVDIINKKEA